MPTKQAPINSDYGPKTTAAEVLRGTDLTGKFALVTGGYSGLGLETTKALAGAGARVVVPARRPAVAEEALRGIEGVEVADLDLADLDSVARCADRLLVSGRELDIVIANAGIMASPEFRVGPGWEGQFAVNHLGHYALVNQLWPAIAAGGARVVGVSSAGHHLSDIRWQDIHFREGYDKWLAYGQAKTAIVLFAVGLDVRGRDSGVRAFATHPGSILTPLQRHMSMEEMAERGWVDAEGNPVDPTFKTPEAGAATQVWAATSPQLAGMGGVYCQDCNIAAMASDTNMEAGGVRPYAIDPDAAGRLWAISAEMTGANAFAPAESRSTTVG